WAWVTSDNLSTCVSAILPVSWRADHRQGYSGRDFFTQHATNNMKTVYQVILILICSAWLAPPGLHAQFVCVDSLVVELGPDGTYTIFPEVLLEVGGLGGLDAVVTPAVVDCDDAGGGNVTLEIFDNGELIHSCNVSTWVFETENPIALCQDEITVTLDQSGQYTLDFEELNNGSWDNCGSFTYTISPPSID